jgi:hypothetical protein
MRIILATLLLLPAWAAEAGVEGALHTAVKECDRIRVRSGGTCHRNVDKERTLFEVKDAKEIRATVLSIQINEKISGGSCMCCGEPTIEFYRGKKLLAMLGFHHSQSVRWASGPWWSDGVLTPKSAASLCAWMARHGYDKAQQDLDELAAQQRSREILFARYEKLLGEETWSRMRKSISRDYMAAVLRRVEVGGDKKRALLYFQLLGCHEGSWERSGALDSPLIDKLIPRLPPAARDHALRAAPGIAFAENGAARWLIYERNTRHVSTELLAELLPALGRSGLAHPRYKNRRRMMISLRKLGGETAIALLREVLAGTIKLRKLPREEVAEPSGMIVSYGEPKAIRKVKDERAVAAYFLAELGDEESRAAIEDLAKLRTGPAEAMLKSAIELLDSEAGR